MIINLDNLRTSSRYKARNVSFPTCANITLKLKLAIAAGKKDETTRNLRSQLPLLVISSKEE